MTATEPGAGIDLAARFELTLGAVSGLTAKMDRVARRLEAPPMQPVWRNFADSDVVPASGFVISALGGPDQGHVWYVRSIVVGGATPATVIGGRADVFVSAADLRNPGAAAQIGLVGWRDQATTLPNVAFYGSGELRLVAGEDLFVVVSGGTAGQAVTSIAYIQDVQDAPLRQELNV